MISMAPPCRCCTRLTGEDGDQILCTIECTWSAKKDRLHPPARHRSIWASGAHCKAQAAGACTSPSHDNLGPPDMLAISRVSGHFHYLTFLSE